MKTVFDIDVREELVLRIGQLSGSDRALWGKMDVRQMVRHLVLSQEWILEGRRLKRVLVGRLFGGMILKKMLKEELLRRNSPSLAELIVMDTDVDLDRERQALMGLVQGFGAYAYPAGGFVHPFFGRMTREQVGYFVYKHLDHHLRQFGR
jgi:hypothetical protein